MSMGAKIWWSEGLTLGPQYFRRQDLYHETRLLRMASALNPNFWGARSLQWNMEGLCHNMLEAQAMSLIFQSGGRTGPVQDWIARRHRAHRGIGTSRYHADAHAAGADRGAGSSRHLLLPTVDQERALRECVKGAGDRDLCAGWDTRAEDGANCVHTTNRHDFHRRRSRRDSAFGRLNKCLGRYAKPLVQFPDHRKCQRANAIQHLVHPVGSANHRL